MVRQKTPAAKPLEKHKRVQTKPVKSDKVDLEAVIKSLQTQAEPEPEHLGELESANPEHMIDKVENLADHDEEIDYEFELDENNIEPSKEFEDPEELPPQDTDKAAPFNEYIEQISDRVASKLADVLAPSLEEIKFGLTKLVDLLSNGKYSPSKMPITKVNAESMFFGKMKQTASLAGQTGTLPPKALVNETNTFKPRTSNEPTPLAAAASNSDNSAFLSIDKNLSYLKINSIYHKSHSIQNFATNLLLHLFDIAELTQNVNVNGRVMNGKTAKGALDEKRINIIRQIVEEKAEYEEDVWPSCVNAMNKKISAIKKLKRRS